MVEYFKSVRCESNSTLGHCVIFALIINDFFVTFYYNIVDGEVLDLMDVLFLSEIIRYEYIEEVTKEVLLSSVDIKCKYEKYFLI